MKKLLVVLFVMLIWLPIVDASPFNPPHLQGGPPSSGPVSLPRFEILLSYYGTTYMSGLNQPAPPPPGPEFFLLHHGGNYLGGFNQPAPSLPPNWMLDRIHTGPAPTPTPVPTSIALFGTGLIALAAFSRKKRQRQ